MSIQEKYSKYLENRKNMEGIHCSVTKCNFKVSSPTSPTTALKYKTCWIYLLTPFQTAASK